MIADLKDIYSRMYLIRRAEEKICSLYSEDDMKTPSVFCVDNFVMSHVEAFQSYKVWQYARQP
jgi:TPP-dependent pyruvate/acetoin dehydrogenase alpha subunit